MTAYSLLLQLNARLLLDELSHRFRRPATLADIPDEQLDKYAALGIDWIYLLGVWRLGVSAPAISRADPALLEEGRSVLAGFTPADIAGSCFAITGYEVAAPLGGDGALADLRERLGKRSIRLMLDFIPNHTAPDHPWVRSDPDLYVQGDERALASDPRNWRRVATDVGDRIIALGRDPYFAGWPDTLQLDYSSPRTRALMSDALVAVASRADGARADMAMLVLPDVFRRTWGREAGEFWPGAIQAARAADGRFTMLAEVYWGLEDTLLKRGFDHTYDKGFYDALVARDRSRLRGLLRAPADRQARMARFLENHDEPRAAALFGWPEQRAATAIAFFSPAMRFLHQGQMEGARTHVSMHFARGPVELPDPDCAAFHAALLRSLPRQGSFRVLDPEPAWHDNPTHANFFVLLWREAPEDLLVCINDSRDDSQCRVRLDLGPGPVHLEDQLSNEAYDRDGGALSDLGLYLALAPWSVNAFRITKPLPVETKP